MKNKVAPPFRVAEFDIIYGKGISKAGEIIEVAIELGIIQKSGSWFSYNGEKVAQGKENTKKAIAENEALMKELEEKIKLQGKDIDLSSDDTYSLDEDDEANLDEEDSDDFDIRLLDIENDD